MSSKPRVSMDNTQTTTVTGMRVDPDVMAVTDAVQAALASQVVIEQAKGILIERYKVTAVGAWEMLARVSRRNNTEVRDLADHLVRTGEFRGYESPDHAPHAVGRCQPPPGPQG